MHLHQLHRLHWKEDQGFEPNAKDRQSVSKFLTSPNDRSKSLLPQGQQTPKEIVVVESHLLLKTATLVQPALVED
jgi:hypothetical protein